MNFPSESEYLGVVSNEAVIRGRIAAIGIIIL